MAKTTSETSPERSAQMARVRGRDTKPEMRVRRALHAAGLRYRLHAKGLPGRPDLIFPSRRVVVFVHGCFRHRHPDPDCKLARLPKSRLDFWIPKLEGNRAGDERVKAELRGLGWRVFEVWEREAKLEALNDLARRIKKIRPRT
ncbi:very short patch repair endonuclease [Bradyrhizobium sp. 176]|uniref:very short patch repair endonuclease n=1 Tax=unclassified Bradyrhizobium TaxID=2631580 RepID=UPI002A12D302|nr:DNA mismatch endonuclease Vsr [Bradyrhizobium sp. 176]MCK1556202.1 DNA mismatch endonuclease Vsr [Bradyrhizobium sp. 171]